MHFVVEVTWLDLTKIRPHCINAPRSLACKDGGPDCGMNEPLSLTARICSATCYLAGLLLSLIMLVKRMEGREFLGHAKYSLPRTTLQVIACTLFGWSLIRSITERHNHLNSWTYGDLQCQNALGCVDISWANCREAIKNRSIKKEQSGQSNMPLYGHACSP